MDSIVSEPFITKNHDRLLRIASFSRIFAWIALIFQILYSVMMFFEFQIPYLVQTITKGNSSEIPMALRSFLDYLILPNTGLLVLLTRGIIYFLVLKGISAGLKMIVETDLNYKEKNLEVENGI
jgi:hypothetical protein